MVESNIRNIGSTFKCSKLSSEGMQKIADLLGEEYPAESSAYRLGEFVLLYPMERLYCPLASCEWALATNIENNEPLALFPDISRNDADNLRIALCCFAKAPLVFYYRPTDAVYLAHMHYDRTIGAWFALSTHDFIHSDINL